MELCRLDNVFFVALNFISDIQKSGAKCMY